MNFFVYALHFLSFLFTLGSILTLLFSGMKLISDSGTITHIQTGIVIATLVCVFAVISLKVIFNKKNNLLLFLFVLILALVIFFIVMIGYLFFIAWLNNAIVAPI